MSEDRKRFDVWLNSEMTKHKDDVDMLNYYRRNEGYLRDGFINCAKIKDAEIERIREFYSTPLSTYLEIEQLNAKYAKLRELAEKVATAGYYTHPIATAIDELRNYLKEVK